MLQTSSRHDRLQQLLPAHFKETTALTEWIVLQLNLTLGDSLGLPQPRHALLQAKELSILVRQRHRRQIQLVYSYLFIHLGGFALGVPDLQTPGRIYSHQQHGHGQMGKALLFITGTAKSEPVH